MKVRISYHDNESFTVEEVVATARRNYGSNANVEVYSESNLPHDLVYFALQQIISHQQISLFYDKSGSYQSDIKKLREETLYKVAEILDDVIIDNEAKISGD